MAAPFIVFYKLTRDHGDLLYVGAGLARDGINSAWLSDRVACIAGKPAPTFDCIPDAGQRSAA
ncbi:hypothetical protein GNF76_27990 [Pseudomonas sp. CCM 7893]|uniref:Uncharacterized protein n=1 Tax=Pseudomonas spelaei TaxID=1055469 RepID=A0A6I3WLE0_9PSED|nr:hypothetical protein [Pseudomonas spelaei]MUF08183.1 hypothetical protein [Pseudomonas spelaei]